MSFPDEPVEPVEPDEPLEPVEPDEPVVPVRIAAFDFDGTILEGHSPVCMVRRLVSRRIIPYGVALKVLWWGVRYRLRLPVNQSVVRSYIFASLSHMSVSEVDAFMTELYRLELAQLIRPKAREAILACRDAGEKTVIVSASFRPLLAQAASDVGVDWFICTEMEVSEGSYTGHLLGEAPEGEQKAIQLIRWADATFGPGAWELTHAFGDHYSDESLLSLARTPVAINPETLLEKTARKRGWQILDWSFEPKESVG
ncbi:MAG: HAD-IB family hydrolase [Coriobacteriales bacterium]|jgi:HAD superfamily hydrolase (TIGR01490 family)|nr:HAD-IB family hydrolase [Coriobacteriales bacterium]